MHKSQFLSTKTTRCKNAVTAGSADITDATVLDMEGFDSVIFTFAFGTITAGAVTSVKVKGSPDNGTTESDLVGTSITVLDTDDNTLVIVEIVNLQSFRYVRPYVSRATQNAVVDSIVGEQYSSRKSPQSDDATSVSHGKSVVSPAATSTALTNTDQTFTTTTKVLNTTSRTSS